MRYYKSNKETATRKGANKNERYEKSMGNRKARSRKIWGES